MKEQTLEGKFYTIHQSAHDEIRIILITITIVRT